MGASSIRFTQIGSKLMPIYCRCEQDAAVFLSCAGVTEGQMPYKIPHHEAQMVAFVHVNLKYSSHKANG